MMKLEVAYGTTTVGGRVSYIGSRTVEAEVPTVQGLSPFIKPVEWRPYTLVDLFADYKLSANLTAEFRIENVGDVYYVDLLGLATFPAPAGRSGPGLR
ncbi:MAG: hypothetical protein AB7G35_01130 [Hyphomicrobiaceae bacterium]